MELSALKLSPVQRLLNVERAEFLQGIQTLLDQEEAASESLTATQHKLLDERDKQARNGHTLPYDQVQSNMNDLLSSL